MRMTIAALLAMACLALVMGCASTDSKSQGCDTCGLGKDGGTGWCEACGKGYVDGELVECKGCYLVETGETESCPTHSEM